MSQTSSLPEPPTQDTPVAQLRLDYYRVEDLPKSVRDDIERRIREIIEDTDYEVLGFYWHTYEGERLNQSRLEIDGFDYVTTNSDQKETFALAMKDIFNDNGLEWGGVGMRTSHRDPRSEEEIMRLINSLDED